MINQNLLLAGDDAYNLTKSLRFRSSASAYLTRTPASTTNRKTWVWSSWVKRGSLGVSRAIFGSNYNDAGTQADGTTNLLFDSSDRLDFGISRDSVGVVGRLITTAVYRDPSAWYHIALLCDTTQSTSSLRLRLFVNGLEVTSFSTATYPSQNWDTEINKASRPFRMGAICSFNTPTGVESFFDGYLTEVNFIDGQALAPSSFGETDVLTGVWKPKKYAGTYGTNGFYLPFTDVATTSGSNAGLGKDFSGNGNYWNTNNISVTAGTTYDSMTDVPTMSALGSNYAVLNPLNAIGTTATFSNANLSLVLPDGSLARTAFATMGVSSGKWYWEVTVGTTAATYYPGIGVNTNTSALPTNQSGADATGYMYMVNGQKFNNGSLTSYGATYATNDVIGVALDMDAGTITFYKNNTSQGQAFSGLSGTAVPCFIGQVNASCAVNFGARPFSYTPPTGFVALNTFNLPEPSIKQGNKHFDATTYTGTGATQSIVNAGGFQPSLVWFKRRSAVENHWLTDAVRGSTKGLFSNLTDAEATRTDQLTSFNSNGFTLGADGAGYTNINTNSYIAWQWKGNGAGVSNTAGSITSTVSANPTAGFSVVTYTGNGATATVGHGLGAAPKMVIVKNKGGAGQNWAVYHASIGVSNVLFLNTTDSAQAATNKWNGTNSSVVGLNSAGDINASGGNYVAYCFSEVAGYSKFGSYTGNGSADGTFVHLGFRPKFVLIKSTSTAVPWVMYDSARDTFNVGVSNLYPNLSNAEGVGASIDFLSNGFKLRTSSGDANPSGNAIYMAFAESPFKYSLGR